MRAPFAILVSVGLMLAVSAAQAVEVERQLVVDAPADVIWQKIGEPCSLKLWAPGIGDCTEKTVKGRIVRTITAGQGGQFVEEIVASGKGYYAYIVLQGPLPISNYISVFALKPDANDPAKTLITWRAEFDADDANKLAAANTVGGIYESGLAAIASFVMKSP